MVEGCLALISHRPDRVVRFRRLPVVPPGLAPPAATATEPGSRSLHWMQLQFQIDLLHLSASSPIFLSFFFLSPPPIPMSLKKAAIEAAGKPRQPTSTVQILTVQPLLLPSLSISEYFALFNSPETSTLSSLGTVSSTIPIFFELFESSIMSGRRFVEATFSGILSFPSKSAVRLQSEAPSRKLAAGCWVFLLVFSPSLYKLYPASLCFQL